MSWTSGCHIPRNNPPLESTIQPAPVQDHHPHNDALIFGRTTTLRKLQNLLLHHCLQCVGEEMQKSQFLLATDKALALSGLILFTIPQPPTIDPRFHATSFQLRAMSLQLRTTSLPPESNLFPYTLMLMLNRTGTSRNAMPTIGTQTVSVTSAKQERRWEKICRGMIG
jgi:hypothetical protein